MKRIILISGILLGACVQNIIEGEADFVYGVNNVEGDEAYYSKAAVITGHIANREVYPKTKDVSITIPFYILIDKDGVIVDFREHLRPSVRCHLRHRWKFWRLLFTFVRRLEINCTVKI